MKGERFIETHMENIDALSLSDTVPEISVVMPVYNVARYVGEKLGWEYNESEGKAARSFLEYAYHL